MREIVYFDVWGFELFVGLRDTPSASAFWYESGQGFAWRRLEVSWASPWTARGPAR